MTASSVFERVLAALQSAGISTMLTGSFASSFHGAPRATQDIDLVIDPTPEQVRTLVRLLKAEQFYADEGAALEALRQQGLFNAIDVRTGWKVDFIIRKSRPFSREEFGRRTAAQVEGIEMPVATPEDVVIAKMEWARMGQSARQIEDAAKMLRVHARSLDWDYLEYWVGQMALDDQWAEVQRSAGVSGRPV